MIVFDMLQALHLRMLCFLHDTLRKSLLLVLCGLQFCFVELKMGLMNFISDVGPLHEHIGQLHKCTLTW